MNYKKALAMIVELQALVALLDTPDARWRAVQDWLKANPRWKDEIDYYVTISPDEAVHNIKLFLIEETAAPGPIIAAAVTPAIEAQAKRAIERLQTLYKDRKAQGKRKASE